MSEAFSNQETAASEAAREPIAQPAATGEAAARRAVERVPSAAVEPATGAGAQPLTSTPQRPTMRELLVRIDDGWARFRVAAGAFPSERMDERLTDGGWSRKQMLAHISAWHDQTHDRLGTLISTGRSARLSESDDSINARVARQAIGRTGGEVLKEMEMTFNRLRRRVVQLTDDQLAADDGWALHVIAGNTYEHYQEHRDDVNMPEPAEAHGERR